MPRFKMQSKSVLLTGARQGWSSFLWMCQIIIPVSFLVCLLQWTGWLNRIDFLLDPLMSLIHLPSAAALPIISGILINLYAAIAVMSVLPFTPQQMTLIAVFTLITHNLIAEAIIQHRSGINGIKASLIRLAVSIVTVLLISPFLGDTSLSVAVPAELNLQSPLLMVLKDWALDTAILLLKIFGIIMFIMILLEISKSLGWLEYLLTLFRPIMGTLGLSQRTATLWLTAVLFGLLYGGAVIVEETKKEALTKEELEYLHISIGINHAMVEDPALFLILGLNGFWLWVPKLVMAIAAVQSYRALRRVRRGPLQRWLARRG